MSSTSPHEKPPMVRVAKIYCPKGHLMLEIGFPAEKSDAEISAMQGQVAAEAPDNTCEVCGETGYQLRIEQEPMTVWQLERRMNEDEVNRLGQGQKPRNN